MRHGAAGPCGRLFPGRWPLLKADEAAAKARAKKELLRGANLRHKDDLREVDNCLALDEIGGMYVQLDIVQFDVATAGTAADVEHVNLFGFVLVHRHRIQRFLERRPAISILAGFHVPAHATPAGRERRAPPLATFAAAPFHLHPG